MSDLVQITVSGRLTRDAELRHPGDQAVLNFTVAAKPYGSEESSFFNVAIWGKRGESLEQYLTKGTQVVVVGGFSERKYEHNGEKRVSLEIRSNEVALVGGGAKTEGDASGGSDDDDFADFN